MSRLVATLRVVSRPAVLCRERDRSSAFRQDRLTRGLSHLDRIARYRDAIAFSSLSARRPDHEMSAVFDRTFRVKQKDILIAVITNILTKICCVVFAICVDKQHNDRCLMDDELPRIVNKKELRLLVPYSPQHILRLEKDNEFPKRIQIGKRRVGWSLKEIKDWIATRVALGHPARRRRLPPRRICR